MPLPPTTGHWLAHNRRRPAAACWQPFARHHML